MKLLLSVALCLAFSCAIAQAAQNPTLSLEKQIAYQQGQFAALYDHCGSVKDREVIGGSAAVWRSEIMEGYKGTPAEKNQLEQSFAQAVSDVMADKNSCQEWIRQAATTWHSIMRLADYGEPVLLMQQASNK